MSSDPPVPVTTEEWAEPDGVPRRVNHVEGPDGWSEWTAPLPGYRMICCDCGLSHELEFKVINGSYVVFRGRRHNRSTAQVRRHMRKKDAANAE